MELIFADLHLARRLEASDAVNAACAAPESLPVAGGIAAFAGAGSPLTHAIGVGMYGPVGAAELDRIEEFYRSRASSVNLDLCPLADPSLAELLGRREYRVVEFNNVLVRRISDIPLADDRVRQAEASEGELWAETMVRGFFERDRLSDAEIEIGRALFRMPGSTAWFGFTGEKPVAAAAASVSEGLLTMFSDSTLPAHRGRGLHRAIINARIAWGAEHGCDTATAATLPGSISQRNYQRAGFQIAYTKTNMQRDWA